MSPSLRLPSSPRSRLLIVVLAVSILAAVMLVAFRPSSPTDAAASPPDQSPTAEDRSTPTPTPTPTATTPATPRTAANSPTLDPGKAANDAQAALRSYLALADQTYHRADGEIDTGLAGVAVGAALGEVEAGTLELWNAGSRQVGTVQVAEISTDEVDVTSDPPTIVLTACLDTADVDILDANGDSSRLGRPGIVTRTTHIYRVELSDDVWRVAGHDFPDEAGC